MSNDNLPVSEQEFDFYKNQLVDILTSEYMKPIYNEMVAREKMSLIRKYGENKVTPRIISLLKSDISRGNMTKSHIRGRIEMGYYFKDERKDSFMRRCLIHVLPIFYKKVRELAKKRVQERIAKKMKAKAA